MRPLKVADAVGVLEVRELVGGPEPAVDLGVALDLHHLDQRLEVAAQLRRTPRSGACRRCRAGSNIVALAAVGVVRNRHAASSPASPAPPSTPRASLRRLVSSSRERHVRHVQVAEDDVAVHVAGLVRRRPLETGQRRELAGLVVVAHGLQLDRPSTRSRRLRPRVERRVLRVLAADVVDHVLHEPRPAARPRSSARAAPSSIGLSPPLAPGTCVEYISPMNSAWSDTAAQSSGFLMLCVCPCDGRRPCPARTGRLVRREARPADVGVQRERRVHVRLAEVGLLQRVVRHGRLELLDGLRGGRRRRRGLLCRVDCTAPCTRWRGPGATIARARGLVDHGFSSLISRPSTLWHGHGHRRPVLVSRPPAAFSRAPAVRSRLAFIRDSSYFFRYAIFVVPMVPLKANGAWSK